MNLLKLAPETETVSGLPPERMALQKIMETEKTSVEQAYQTLVVIWASLFLSQFMFLVVVFFAKPELFRFDLSKPVLDENAVIVLVFAVLAVSSLLISLVLKKKFLDESVEKQSVGLVQNALIIGSALVESISLFGLVLAFAFDYQYFFFWIALGILGMLLHFPKRENLHQATFQQTQKL